MFGPHATRLTRVDWTKYATAALNPSSGQEPTAEQLKQAIMGMATGFRQFTEELAQVLGDFDIPMKHRAPLILSGYESDAPGVSPDDDMEDFYPRQASISGDSYWDATNSEANGGLAAAFQGVVFFKPNVNNVVINQNNNVLNRIVIAGGNNAGIWFPNIFVENLYDLDGNPFASSTIPSCMLAMDSADASTQTWDNNTYTVGFTSGEEVETDSTVIEFDAGSSQRITLHVAGYYRVSYHIHASAGGTDADSAVETATTVVYNHTLAANVAKTVSVLNKIYKVEGTVSGTPSSIIGTAYFHAAAETLQHFAAETQITIRVTATGLTTGFKPVAEGCSFTATLFKRD
jgi:hypothetical protein